jgi:hypothetical protein
MKGKYSKDITYFQGSESTKPKDIDILFEIWRK